MNKAPSMTTVIVANMRLSCRLANEVVVLNDADGKYYGLTGAGVRIWELVKKPTRIEEIVAALVSEFHVDERQCEKDVLEFLRAMAGKGLVSVKDPDETSG